MELSLARQQMKEAYIASTVLSQEHTLLFYDLIGYSQLQVSDVQVKSDQIRKLSDFTLTTASYGTGGPVIIRAEKPLIDINGGTAISLGARELKDNAAANGGSLKAILSSMSSDIIN